MPSQVWRLGQPLRLASQKWAQQRTVFSFASVNFGVVCLPAILLLSFCDVAGSSACRVAGEMAGVDGADRFRRQRGAAEVAGSAVGKASGEEVTKDSPAGSIEADCNADGLSLS